MIDPNEADIAGSDVVSDSPLFALHQQIDTALRLADKLDLVMLGIYLDQALNETKAQLAQLSSAKNGNAGLGFCVDDHDATMNAALTLVKP